MGLYYRFFNQPASGDFVNYNIDLGPYREGNLDKLGFGFANIPTGELGRITETGIAEFATGAFDDYLRGDPYDHVFGDDFEDGSDVDPMKGVFYLTGDINKVDFITSFTGSNSRMYDQDNNLFYSYGDLFQNPFALQGNIHEFYQNYSVNNLPVNSNVSRGCGNNISGFYYSEEALQYQVSVRDSTNPKKWEPSLTGSAQELMQFDASIYSSFEFSENNAYEFSEPGVNLWKSVNGGNEFEKWEGGDSTLSALEGSIEAGYDVLPLLNGNQDSLACKDVLYFSRFPYLKMDLEDFNGSSNFAIIAAASFDEGSKNRTLLSYGANGVKGSFNLHFDGNVEYNKTSGSSFSYEANEAEAGLTNIYTFLFNVEGMGASSENKKDFISYLNGKKTNQLNDWFFDFDAADLPPDNSTFRLTAGYNGGFDAAGYIAELIILPNIANIGEFYIDAIGRQLDLVKTIEGYLAHKWNVAERFWINHPFKKGYPAVFESGLKGGPLEFLHSAMASNNTHY